MCQEEYEAAVAAFIRSKGVTRCPTACALPTQGTVTPPTGRRSRAMRRPAACRVSRRSRIAERSFWAAKILAGPGE